MANGNPFYVMPGNDLKFDQLSNSMINLGQMKAKERAQEKYEKMKLEATAVFATKDPDKIAQFMIDNPEMAKAMEVSYSFHDKATKENYLKSAYAILQAHEQKSKSPSMSPSAPGTPMTASVPSPVEGIEAAGEYPYDPSVLELEEPPGTPYLNAEGQPMSGMEVLHGGMLPGQIAGPPEPPEPPEPKLPPEMASVIEERKGILNAKGVPPGQTQETDAFAAAYSANPEVAIKSVEHDIATMDPKGWKAWKEIYRPTEAEGAKTQLSKWMNERDALLEEGYAEDSPEVKAFSDRIWPEKKGKGAAPTNYAKLIAEQKKFIEDGGDPDSDIGKGFKARILGAAADKIYSPSPLLKKMKERNTLADELRKKGLSEEEVQEHPYIRAFDNSIAGIDIDIEEMTDDEVDYWGAWVNLNGKMPSVGRGKQATKIRARIIKSAARQAYEQYGLRYPEKKKGITPTKAALEVVGKAADTKSIQSALTVLAKQKAGMGSFIQNLDAQIDQVGELAKDLPLVDVRLMNVPIRLLHKKVLGNPQLAKYEMYLTEIANEIGRLSSGSPQSIAELSTHAQERWDKIHDPNLSAKDMLSLLEETRHAAQLRMSSVEDQQERTREEMRTREFKKSNPKNYPRVNTPEDYKKIKSGDMYYDVELGKPVRKR